MDEQDITTQFDDMVTVGAFRGVFPQVPTAPGVDMQALTAGDADPLFVTLPVAQVGGASRNGRFYPLAVVQRIAQQVIEKKPTGILGHIREEERASAFPAPAVHWIGALLHRETLWAKGYVPPGPARELLRRLKATGARIGTSIYGTAHQVWDAARGLYVVDADSFNLEQIDFAPAERAGLAALSAQPVLTAEMAARPGGRGGVERCAFPPAQRAQRPAVAGAAPPSAAPDYRPLIAALVDAQVPPGPARAVIAEMVAWRQPGSPDEAQQRVAEALAHPAVGALLRAEAIRQMGPAVRPGVSGRGAPRHIDIPE